MLDLLDHYAAAALTGLCANPERSGDLTLVKQAYRIAKAMMDERNEAFLTSQQNATQPRRDR